MTTFGTDQPIDCNKGLADLAALTDRTRYKSFTG